MVALPEGRIGRLTMVLLPYTHSLSTSCSRRQIPQIAYIFKSNPGFLSRWRIWQKHSLLVPSLSPYTYILDAYSGADWFVYLFEFVSPQEWSTFVFSQNPFHFHLVRASPSLNGSRGRSLLRVYIKNCGTFSECMSFLLATKFLRKKFKLACTFRPSNTALD